MNLVHNLSSIGDEETSIVVELIYSYQRITLYASKVFHRPQHIVANREVILFESGRSVNYRKHAMFMTPLIIICLSLLMSMTHPQVMANYHEDSQPIAQNTRQKSDQTVGSIAITFSDISPHPVTPTPTPEIIQPIESSPPPLPTLIPTVAPVLQTPSNYTDVYRAAGAQYGVPWQILYGIHMAETGLRNGPIMNSKGSGARGPMQFMPGTWRAYGVDGNGDGVINIDDAVDAIYGAANYLSRHGTLDHALTAYGTNKSRVYAAARSLGWNG